jgi:hypothetical protein
MFGRPAEVPTKAHGPVAGRGDLAAERRRVKSVAQKPIPPGLVPWLVPLLIVFVIFVVVVVPALVAVLVLALVFGAVGWTLYRASRRMSYSELRREDPLFRSLEDFRRGRGYRGVDGDGPAD